MKQNWTKLKGETDSFTIVEDFNTSVSIMDRTTRTKDQYGNGGLDQHYKPTRPSRHIQNSPPQNNKMLILLKCTWNVLQDRPYVKPQNKS